MNIKNIFICFILLNKLLWFINIDLSTTTSNNNNNNNKKVVIILSGS